MGSMMEYVLLLNDGGTLYDHYENRDQVIREFLSWLDSALAGGGANQEGTEELQGVAIGHEDSDDHIEVISTWAEVEEEIHEQRARRLDGSSMLRSSGCTSPYYGPGIGGSDACRNLR
jgi:hypothetical protein